MQPRSPRIVELLNEALTLELTITNTYFLHSRMLENWGFGKLAKVFYDLSIDEMRDADSLIQRILMFEGHPNVQKLLPITTGETPHEILQLAYSSELTAIEQFNAAADESRSLGDNGTASVFDAAVREEEDHAEWFESQLEAIKAIGIAAYLAQQVEPGASPA